MIRILSKKLLRLIKINMMKKPIAQICTMMMKQMNRMIAKVMQISRIKILLMKIFIFHQIKLKIIKKKVLKNKKKMKMMMMTSTSEMKWLKKEEKEIILLKMKTLILMKKFQENFLMMRLINYRFLKVKCN